MKRKRLSIALTLFFLVQGVIIPRVSSAGTFLLNPPTKVSTNDSQFCIKGLCDTICTGLFIYKMDVRDKYSKEKIAQECGGFISRSSDAKFDLGHIDMGRKGWTRYYPFSVNGRDFIMRIFLASERTFQPEAKVLYEGTTSDGQLTFQILPGINEMLESCKIKPCEPRNSRAVDSSS